MVRVDRPSCCSGGLFVLVTVLAELGSYCRFNKMERFIMKMLDADLKQVIARVNNNINLSLFGTGLRKQRVTIVENKIIITADHKRIPALAALDQSDRMSARLADVAILDEYKRRLKEEFVNQLKLPVICVLKDYAPDHELAVTFILVEENLEHKAT